jgi:hypothetical protein
MSNAASEEGRRQGESLVKTYNQGFERGVKIKEGQRKADAMNAFSQAWQSGDMAQLDKVVGMFPEFGKDFQAMIGVRDEQHRQQAATTMMQASTLASTGNGEAIRTLAQKNANVLGEGGVAEFNNIADQIANPDTRDAAVNRLGQMAQGYMVAGMKPSEMASYMQQQSQNAFEQEMKLRDMELREKQARDESARGWAQVNKMGGGAGGPFAGTQRAQLSDGRTVNIYPKVYKQGSQAFQQGIDDNGNAIIVPVDSIVSPMTSSQSAMHQGTSRDLQILGSAPDNALERITGVVTGGSVGEMPFTADKITGQTGTGREEYQAALRLQGLMQNQGIDAAREMGASGINTIPEAKMFFQSMPQLDFSSVKALRGSVDKIRDYVNEVNKKYNINVGAPAGSTPENSSGNKQMSFGDLK